MAESADPASKPNYRRLFTEIEIILHVDDDQYFSLVFSSIPQGAVYRCTRFVQYSKAFWSVWPQPLGLASFRAVS